MPLKQVKPSSKSPIAKAGPQRPRGAESNILRAQSCPELNIIAAALVRPPHCFGRNVLQCRSGLVVKVIVQRQASAGAPWL
jgi:hypothetical protein